jgi:hypothetical protein
MTLGDKLLPGKPEKPGFSFGAWLRTLFYTVLNFSLLMAISALLFWWLLIRPDMDRNTMLFLFATLIALWLFVYRKLSATKPHYKPHYLLANDRQGFMRDLRLDKKTVIFDGSNIYHFGHDNGLDAQPLGKIAHQLRTQGYRVVCFFDANIFYTLSEHGALYAPFALHWNFACRREFRCDWRTFSPS